MGTYMRQAAMITGGPFRCFNCGNLMLIKMGGSHFKLELQCNRCKAYYMVKTLEPIPFKMKHDGKGKPYMKNKEEGTTDESGGKS